MPFAGYKDFDDCVAHNQDKGSGKEAYCAEIMHRTASPSCGGEKMGKADEPVTREEFIARAQEASRENRLYDAAYWDARAAGQSPAEAGKTADRIANPSRRTNLGEKAEKGNGTQTCAEEGCNIPASKRIFIPVLGTVWSLCDEHAQQEIRQRGGKMRGVIGQDNEQYMASWSEKVEKALEKADTNGCGGALCPNCSSMVGIDYMPHLKINARGNCECPICHIEIKPEHVVKFSKVDIKKLTWTEKAEIAVKAEHGEKTFADADVNVTWVEKVIVPQRVATEEESREYEQQRRSPWSPSNTLGYSRFGEGKCPVCGEEVKGRRAGQGFVEVCPKCGWTGLYPHSKPTGKGGTEKASPPSGVKPSIETVQGTANYVTTEEEDENGRWNDDYYTRDGYYVIHPGNGRHHVYQLQKAEKAEGCAPCRKCGGPMHLVRKVYPGAGGGEGPTVVGCKCDSCGNFTEEIEETEKASPQLPEHSSFDTQPLQCPYCGFIGTGKDFFHSSFDQDNFRCPKCRNFTDRTDAQRWYQHNHSKGKSDAPLLTTTPGAFAPAFGGKPKREASEPWKPTDSQLECIKEQMKEYENSPEEAIQHCVEGWHTRSAQWMQAMIRFVEKEVHKSDKIQITKQDTASRKFCGWGTVAIVDKSGEKISAEDVAKRMPEYLERGAPVTLGHTNRVIGKVDSWKLEKAPSGADGIRVCGHIFEHYDVDDKVWKAMTSGKLAMLSIGGDISNRETKCEGGRCHIDLNDPQPYEFAVVPSGMNQEANIDYVNRTAKGDEQTITFAIWPTVEKQHSYGGDAKPYLDSAARRPMRPKINPGSGPQGMTCKDCWNYRMDHASGEKLCNKNIDFPAEDNTPSCQLFKSRHGSTKAVATRLPPAVAQCIDEKAKDGISFDDAKYLCIKEMQEPVEPMYAERAEKAESYGPGKPCPDKCPHCGAKVDTWTNEQGGKGCECAGHCGWGSWLWEGQGGRPTGRPSNPFWSKKEQKASGPCGDCPNCGKELQQERDRDGNAYCVCPGCGWDSFADDAEKCSHGRKKQGHLNLSPEMKNCIKRKVAAGINQEDAYYECLDETGFSTNEETPPEKAYKGTWLEKVEKALSPAERASAWRWDAGSSGEGEGPCGDCDDCNTPLKLKRDKTGFWCICPKCHTGGNPDEKYIVSSAAEWREYDLKPPPGMKAEKQSEPNVCARCPECGSMNTQGYGYRDQGPGKPRILTQCRCNDCGHIFGDETKSESKMDMKVKQYFNERKTSNSSRPDVWTMIKNCVHCSEWVEDFVKSGRGNLMKAVAALDKKLDDLYDADGSSAGTKGRKSMGEPKKTESVNPLEAVVKEMASRMDAMEKSIASFTQTKKDVAPTPAPHEKAEQECPPGMSWDEGAGKCVESQPAPAEQKAATVPEQKTDPIKMERLIQETVHKALAAKGVIVSETPRPELAKVEQDKLVSDSGRIPTQKELAEQRTRRRGNALI